MSKKVIVIGDGPGGLSAALFLSKNGVEVDVYGQDKTAMHWAMLNNYLGVAPITGSDFQEYARRQVGGFGARLHDLRVARVAQADGGFVVETEDGDQHAADYVVLAEGKGARIATDLGADKTDAGIVVDRHGRTNIARAYAVGRGTKVHRSQAIISAGEGAAAALDILSDIHGKDFNDFDTPPDDK